MNRPFASRARFRAAERERTPRLRPRAAFTLIELLIVVAMMSVLSGAFFTIVMLTVRSEAEEGIRSTLRQEGLNAVRAVVRDAHISRGASGGIELAVAAEKRPAPQTFVLNREGGPAGKGAPSARGTIVYRLEGSRLERLRWDDKLSTATAQTLSPHVRACRIAREGELIRVKLELAINRYTKDFVQHYEFATRLGGAFRAGQAGNLSLETIIPATTRQVGNPSHRATANTHDRQVANLFDEGVGQVDDRQVANLSYTEGAQP